jgi:3-oxoadipate enol-lactonase
MHLHVRERGRADEPVVVCLHGQFYDGSIFEALALALSRRFRVLVPDLPGYGGSPPVEPYSSEEVRRAIVSMLASRGIDDAALVGYSRGAYQALALAAGGDLRVSALALLGAAARASAEVRESFRSLARAVRAGEADGVAQAFVAMAIPPHHAAAHPDSAARALAAARAAPQAILAAEFDEASAFPDLLPALAGCAVPTLLRVGEEDRATPPASSEEIWRAMPNARLERVAGVGHLYLEQDADDTIASVERFLTEALSPVR